MESTLLPDTVRDALLAAANMILAGEASEWEETTGIDWEDLQLAKGWLEKQVKTGNEGRRANGRQKD